MIYCPSCGAEIEEQLAYCPNCGAEVSGKEKMSMKEPSEEKVQMAEPGHDQFQQPQQGLPQLVQRNYLIWFLLNFIVRSRKEEGYSNKGRFQAYQHQLYPKISLNFFSLINKL